jgi:hypothetical protein
MRKQILRVESVRLVGPHMLLLRFNDGTDRRVDLLPVLTGTVFVPLRDPEFFSRVALDPVAGTVVWPNGADFAPEYLRGLPEMGQGPGRENGAGNERNRAAGAGLASDKMRHSDHERSEEE